MKTSEKGKELIKSFEGCKYRSYKLQGERWFTVGYGHSSPDVKQGYTYTQAEIDAFFESDIERFEKNVMSYYDAYKWTQPEFDALVSFAFNTGCIDYLTGRGVRSRDEMRAVWCMYCHDSKGDILEGLKRRRERELALFNTPVDAVMIGTIDVIPKGANDE